MFRSVLAQRWCYDFICVCHLLFFLSMDLCLDRHPYVVLNFIYRLSLFVIVCMLLIVSHLYKLTGNYNTNELYCVSSLYNEWVCVLSNGSGVTLSSDYSDESTKAPSHLHLLCISQPSSDVPSFVWMDLHRREHIMLFSVLLYMVL